MNLLESKGGEDNSKLSGKSTSSLLKIIATLAVRGYGYDYKAVKSPIQKDISKDMEEIIGESLSPETIRSWLKLACNNYVVDSMGEEQHENVLANDDFPESS